MTEMAFSVSNSLSFLRVDQNFWQNANRTQALLEGPARTNFLELYITFYLLHPHLHHYYLGCIEQDTIDLLRFHSNSSSAKLP